MKMMLDNFVDLCWHLKIMGSERQVDSSFHTKAESAVMRVDKPSVN